MNLQPHFADVQSHYDTSDEFFRLFLDPTQTYSCAYFRRSDMTLEEAQLAKIDLSLSKLGLQPGMTLLDVGCGWGATLRRAVENYDVNVVGLTLSKNQAEHVRQMFDQMNTGNTARSRQVLLGGWEQFHGSVDRIVSIGAFEHFGFDRYDAFFRMAHAALPDDGVMMLHTICAMPLQEMIERRLLTDEAMEFHQFIATEIFPGGQLPSVQMVGDHARAAGFTVQRVQSLRPHYAMTLDRWAQALEEHETEAVMIQSPEVFDRFIRYLSGCAEEFRIGRFDVNQFTLVK